MHSIYVKHSIHQKKTEEVSGMVTNISPFETEMNRGFLQVMVLTLLEKNMYGYSMVKQLEEKGYSLEENTLYPLLRRLEKKGFITGKWDISEDRPRKFYIISEEGRAIRHQLLDIWHRQNEVLKHLLEENKNA
jgi:PadR family transcriptional regulator PadR